MFLNKTSFNLLLICCFLMNVAPLLSQNELLTNVYNRKSVSLNGDWVYIIAPYENIDYYDYRFTEKRGKEWGAFWNTNLFTDKSDKRMVEFMKNNSLRVPGDWNSQAEKFMFYEGTARYLKSFDFDRKLSGSNVYLYFAAVNYKADVYLNGVKLGSHTGGFTPFNFAIPDTLLKAKDNFVAVKVDNKRSKEGIPAMNPDWWNYGGITRDVMLIEEAPVFIRDYFIHLKKNTTNEIEGWIRLNKPSSVNLVMEIPELKLKKTLTAGSDSIPFCYKVKGLKLWSPDSPKLYAVTFQLNNETLNDKIGFRDIQVDGLKVLLNGKSVFFRGICIQEEIPQEKRKAYTKADAIHLLSQAKELNANFVRLAHYPYTEYVVQAADSMGLMVWSEIPVFQKNDFKNKDTYANAESQLKEMVTRDRNRASVIIWSVGNETPVGADRNVFMRRLADKARELDNSRLISCALEIYRPKGIFTANDPLSESLDLIAVNEYLGWYNSTPDENRSVKWQINFNKPLLISETGAEAMGGFHGDRAKHWTEEYQEWYYREQLDMMDKMPENFVGLSPWILNDFRSPRRNIPVLQEGWNNKGLFDQHGNKKKAFFILRDYYDRKERELK